MNRIGEYDSNIYDIKYKGSHYKICLADWDLKDLDLSKIKICRNPQGEYNYSLNIEITDLVTVTKLVCDATNYYSKTKVNGIEPVLEGGNAVYNNLNICLNNIEMVVGKSRNKMPTMYGVVYPFYYSEVIYLKVENGKVSTVDLTNFFSLISKKSPKDLTLSYIQSSMEKNEFSKLVDEICPLEDYITYLEYCKEQM